MEQPKRQPPLTPVKRNLWIDPGAWWLLASAGAIAIILGIGGLYLVRLLARPLAMLIFAITLASALSPLVRLLSQKLPTTLAILLVYLGLIAMFVGLSWIIAPAIAGQARELGTRIPKMVEQVRQNLDVWFGNPGEGSLGSDFGALLGTMGESLLRLPLMITSAIAGILLVLFLSFYMLVEAPRIDRFLCSLFPKEQRPQAGNVMAQMLQKMGGYVRGVFLMGVTMSVLSFIGLSLLRVEFPLVLGILSGFFEMIPIIGPIISGIIILAITLLQTPGKVLIVFIFIVALQQSETHILVPLIMRTQTNIPPLVSILALFTGGLVGGLLGILIAIPVAAALQVLTIEVIAPAIRRANGNDLEEAE